MKDMGHSSSVGPEFCPIKKYMNRNGWNVYNNDILQMAEQIKLNDQLEDAENIRHTFETTVYVLIVISR